MASALPDNLQDLQDDIDLYQSLLDSCEGLEGMNEEKETYQKRLTALKEKVNKMNAVTSSSAHTASASVSTLAPSAHAYGALPSRGVKRERSQFDDDSEGVPSAKSRKPTPAWSASPPSIADSVGSDVFDDFDDALDEDWSQPLFRNNHDERRRQQEQKRQMEEDEKLARQLQEQWSADSEPAPKPSLSQQVQSTFQPDGSFSRFSQPPNPRSEPFFNIRPARNEVPDSPITVESSDDDLTYLNFSSREWDFKYSPQTGSSRVWPPSFNTTQYMPGAFPNSASHSVYRSLPGSQVYNHQFQDSYAGSSSNPFDVDNSMSSILRQPFPDFSREWEIADPQEVQQELKNLLQNIRPDEELDPNEAGLLQPQGLKVQLMRHQLKGLAWMKKMEEGHNKGGILADDMGLGKTIQALSLMLARRPPQGAHKPTLIVTPVALMEQWKREISKLIRPRDSFTIMMLHGQNAHIPWSKIAHVDVVLTSYGTLASELKRKLRWEEKLKLNPGSIKAKSDECPVLDEKAKFHRVILDEAQWIKNRLTKTALAACRVDAKYRWCLSGTPMQNSVEEVFSLIKFCRIKPYNDWEKFNRDIARPLKNRYQAAQERAMEKIQALLKAVLLRRTKKSEVDGQPILDLPEKHTIEDRAIFSQDQLDFYQALETQSRIQFNKFVKNGSVGQNYSKALVLLLRLRQCCCSPQLVTNSADFVVDSGIEGTDLEANAKDLARDVVNRIKALEDSECPICMDAADNPIIFNPCGHALCHDCFSKMVDNMTTQEDSQNIKCPHCRATINTKKITDFISFQKVYGDNMNPVGNVDSDDDSDSDSDSDTDESSDSDDGADLKDFIVNDDESLEDSDGEDDNKDDLDFIKNPKRANATQAKSNSKTKAPKSAKRKKSGKTKGKSSQKGKQKKNEHKSLADLRKEGVKSRAAKRKYLRQLTRIYEPCAKIDKTLELLHEIRERGQGEKTIVFSSFTSFLDLIEVPLHQDQELNNYTRYDGSMTAKDRNDAVLRFTDDPNCRTILVSLKAGNAGLNLTAANHVIILDPFWNPFVEYQAADRCHRIGQKREVTVHRVLIGEEGVDHAAEPERMFTVEDRILALQEKKRKLVENALDENATSGITRLGVRELGYLFGVNDMPTLERQRGV